MKCLRTRSGQYIRVAPRDIKRPSLDSGDGIELNATIIYRKYAPCAVVRDAYEQVRAIQLALIQPDQVLLQLAGGFNGRLQRRIVAATVEQNQKLGPPTSSRPSPTERGGAG